MHLDKNTPIMTPQFSSYHRTDKEAQEAKVLSVISHSRGIFAQPANPKFDIQRSWFVTHALCLLLIGGLLSGCQSLFEWQPSSDLAAMSSLTNTLGDSTASTAVEARLPEYLTDQPDTARLAGWLDGIENYVLYSAGPSLAGDSWFIDDSSMNRNDRFVVALFDEQMALLARIEQGNVQTDTIIARHDCEMVYIGIWPGNDGKGGWYDFHVNRVSDGQVPGPQRQVVSLCFEGVDGLNINGYRDLTFGIFDAADIGPQYANYHQEIKDSIIQTIRACYHDYNITFIAEADENTPAQPFTTIYFGGRGGGQLGIADEVDPYNSNVVQNAVIFTDSFAAYAAMELSPQSLGRMIGNVASHELGHLLGLYHVRGGERLMCEAAGITAWEMAGVQQFGAADLDPRVFPIGIQNAPKMLAEIVGLRSD